MKELFKDYRNYAISKGVNGNTLDSYFKAINGIISPSIIEERQLNAVTMDIYSRMIMDRMVVLGTGINDDVANIISCQLMYLNSIDDASDIKLLINSGGGSCTDGLVIYDIMNWVDCDVATYALGMAASMASVLLSSGTKGKRYALPHARIMIHQPMSGLSPYTQESDFKIAYDELAKCKDTLFTILSENTGKSKDEIINDGDRDHWLSPEEALPGVYGKYGVIDNIIAKDKK